MEGSSTSCVSRDCESEAGKVNKTMKGIFLVAPDLARMRGKADAGLHSQCYLGRLLMKTRQTRHVPGRSASKLLATRVLNEEATTCAAVLAGDFHTRCRGEFETARQTRRAFSRRRA